MERKQRTWWRWLGRAAVTLLGMAAVGAVCLGWQLWSDHAEGSGQLTAAVAELDESDPGWRWEEIEAGLAPIPDAENSALVVQRVVESFGGWKPGQLKGPDGLDLLATRPAPNRPLDEPKRKVIQDELAAHEPSVALAVSLKDYPRGRTSVRLTDDVISTLLPHVQPVREVANLLDLDIERLLHAGRAAQAPDRVRAILHASASLRDEPFLISLLVRIAVRQVAVRRVERILARGVLTDAACRDLQELLEAERREEALAWTLRCERALNHRLFSNLEAGRPTVPVFFASATESKGPSLWERALLSLYRYRLPEDHANSLRLFDEVCSLARLPAEEQQAAWEAFDATMKEGRRQAAPQGRRLISYLMMPAANKVGAAALRDQAATACALAGLEAERHRLAHGGWPEVIGVAPPDPYTGAPLLLARRADGLTIYSVGANGTDDGGDLEPPPQGGVSLDLGFRLYDR